MAKGNDKGIENLEEVVDSLVNLGEALANSDRNNDGKTTTAEVLGTITMNSGAIFALAKDIPEAVAEAKDIDVLEARKVVISAITEIDRLTKEQKEWLKGLVRHTTGVADLLLEAKEVW